MIIARVVGSTVSTIKDFRLTGHKLLILRRADPDGSVSGPTFIAVDTVGAGEGELVFVAEGSAARCTDKTTSAPIDAAIVGIIDSLEYESQVSFRKS
jgi:ethanolamine utilization protein EutN